MVDHWTGSRRATEVSLNEEDWGIRLKGSRAKDMVFSNGNTLDPAHDRLMLNGQENKYQNLEYLPPNKAVTSDDILVLSNKATILLDGKCTPQPNMATASIILDDHGSKFDWQNWSPPSSKCMHAEGYMDVLDPFSSFDTENHSHSNKSPIKKADTEYWETIPVHPQSRSQLIKEIIKALSSEDREFLYRELSSASESSKSYSSDNSSVTGRQSNRKIASFELNGDRTSSSIFNQCLAHSINSEITHSHIDFGNKHVDEMTTSPPMRNVVLETKESVSHYSQVLQLITDTEKLAESISALLCQPITPTKNHQHSMDGKRSLRVWRPTNHCPF